MTSLFSYLTDNLRVSPAENDHLEVTVTLPAEHFRHFLQLLNSLTGFANIVNKHERLTRIKAGELSEKRAAEAQRTLDKYYERLALLYDQYTSEGLSRTAAIKKICALLRSENHPWHSIDLVRPSLIKAGRPWKRGRARKKS